MFCQTLLLPFFIESGNLILAELFERISMYRGAMEPTLTSGGCPGGGCASWQLIPDNYLALELDW